jgi:predicted secreted protein
MATTNPEYGKNRKLSVHSTSSTVVITNLTSNGISKTMDNRDVTTKDSASWREVRTTYKSGEISFEGLYSEDSTNGYAELHTLWEAGAVTYWSYGSGTSGDRKESGQGIITSLEGDDPHDGNSSFTGSIMITGEITVGTYA